MRRLLQVGALLSVLTNPSTFYTPAAYAADPTTSVAIPIVKLNLASPTLIDATVPKPDFTVDFVIPAQKAEAAREQALLQGHIDALAAKLSATGHNPIYAVNYVKAQSQTDTPAELIAAVHIVESGQSGDREVTSSAGAQGPMQFLPSTWARWAVDGNGDGTANITSVDDAIATAANYLRAGGADTGNYQNALFSYNHAQWYVDKVLGVAQSLGLK
jgi:soluble lytic murein transglycosylase-like protein